MRRSIPSLGLAAAVTTALLAAPAAAAPKKVLVIGVDGLMLDRVAAADAPTLDGLIGSSLVSKTTLYADPMAPTVSGPGWATIATGVWPDKHKVTSNSWGKTNQLATYPDFLTRLENADSTRTTYAAATWAPLVDDSAGKAIFSPKVDKRLATGGDQNTADKGAAELRANGPDATFLHFDDVDAAGHSCGNQGACYLTAIGKVDRQIKQVVDAVRARSGEDWTIIVTADHGHTPGGGHGGNTPDERASFVLLNAPGVAKGTPSVAPKNVDIAATVLTTFGLPVPAALDGRPVGATSSDPFDTLTGSLKTRQDETAIPASVLGWTKSTPQGWSIDNTAMGTGGVAEWSGWTFTTDDFWTRTDPGQSRETNVRARGVFAVADSDEWADKTTNGTFTSTLKSQPYDVSGATKATIAFGSHYLKEGDETATVAISFDGGKPTTVLTYAADAIAKQESISVNVPSGAAKAQVTWTLSKGANNWYWAVDAPTLTKN